MEGPVSQSTELRPRFRSFKYNISRRTSEKKPDYQSLTKNGERCRDSIINIGKLGSVLKIRNGITTHNQTINLSAKIEDNVYVRTFTTFFSKDYNSDDKENFKFKVLIPEYDHEFDEQPSDFTFLDTMVKPVRFIENQLAASDKQLKRQSKDVEMLRAELNALKNNINNRINDISLTVNEKLKQLKQNFHSCQVLQNERKLRSRKQLKLLQKGQDLHMRMMQNLKQRNLQIQQRIFDCHPLELQFTQAPVLEINDNDYL